MSNSETQIEFDIENDQINDLISKPRNWIMLFFDNWYLTHTDAQPTYAGFYRNLGFRKSDGFAGAWTLRFSDGYYDKFRLFLQDMSLDVKFYPQKRNQ